MQSYEQLAIEITRAAIERGHCGDGRAATLVAEYFDAVCATLRQVDVEVGSDAMVAAAEFAVSSIEAGLLFSRDESAEFIVSIAESYRSTTSRLGGASGIGAR